MSTDSVSPLRQRMIEDMTSRQLGAHTQRGAEKSCAVEAERAFPCVSWRSARSTNSISPPLCAHAAPCGDRRDGHPKILAQRLARVRCTEQAAALELGHYEANEILLSSRDVGRGNDQ